MENHCQDVEKLLIETCRNIPNIFRPDYNDQLFDSDELNSYAIKTYGTETLTINQATVILNHLQSEKKIYEKKDEMVVDTGEKYSSEFVEIDNILDEIVHCPTQYCQIYQNLVQLSYKINRLTKNMDKYEIFMTKILSKLIAFNHDWNDYPLLFEYYDKLYNSVQSDPTPNTIIWYFLTKVQLITMIHLYYDKKIMGNIVNVAHIMCLACHIVQSIIFWLRQGVSNNSICLNFENDMTFEEVLYDKYRKLLNILISYCNTCYLSENVICKYVTMCKRVILYEFNLESKNLWPVDMLLHLIKKYPQHLDFIWQEIIDILNSGDFPHKVCVQLPYEFMSCNKNIKFHDYFIFMTMQASIFFICGKNESIDFNESTLIKINNLVDRILVDYFIQRLNFDLLEQNNINKTPTKTYVKPKKQRSLSNSPYIRKQPKSFIFGTPPNKISDRQSKNLFFKNGKAETLNSSFSDLLFGSADDETECCTDNLLTSFVDTLLFLSEYPQFPSCYLFLYFIARLLIEKIRNDNLNAHILKSLLATCNSIFFAMNQKNSTVSSSILGHYIKTSASDGNKLSDHIDETSNPTHHIILIMLDYLHKSFYINSNKYGAIDKVNNKYLVNSIWNCVVDSYLLHVYFDDMRNPYSFENFQSYSLNDNKFFNFLHNCVKDDPTVLSTVVNPNFLTKENIHTLVRHLNNIMLSCMQSEAFMKNLIDLLKQKNPIIRSKLLGILDQKNLFHSKFIENEAFFPLIEARVYDTCWMVRLQAIQLVGNICIVQKCEKLLNLILHRASDVQVKVRVKAISILKQILLLKLFPHLNIPIFCNLLQRLKDESIVKISVVKILEKLLEPVNHTLILELLDGFVQRNYETCFNHRTISFTLQAIFKSIMIESIQKNTGLKKEKNGEINLHTHMSLNLLNFLQFVLISILNKMESSYDDIPTYSLIAYSVTTTLCNHALFTSEQSHLKIIFAIIESTIKKYITDYKTLIEPFQNMTTEEDTKYMNSLDDHVSSHDQLDLNQKSPLTCSIYIFLDLLCIFIEKYRTKLSTANISRIEHIIQVLITDDSSVFSLDTTISNKWIRVYSIVFYKNYSKKIIPDSDIHCFKKLTKQILQFIPKFIIDYFQYHYKTILSQMENPYKRVPIKNSLLVIAYLVRYFQLDNVSVILDKIETNSKYSFTSILDHIVSIYEILYRNPIIEDSLKITVVMCICYIFERWSHFLVKNSKITSIFEEIIKDNSSSNVLAFILRALITSLKALPQKDFQPLFKKYNSYIIDNTLCNKNIQVRYYAVQLLATAYKHDLIPISVSIQVFAAVSIADPKIKTAYEYLKELYKMDSIFMSFIKLAIEKAFKLWSCINPLESLPTRIIYPRTNVINDTTYISLFQPIIDIINNNMVYNSNFSTKTVAANNNREVFYKVLLSIYESTDILSMKLFIIENLHTINNYTEKELKAIFRFFDILTNTAKSNVDRVISLNTQLFFYRRMNGVINPEYTLRKSSIYDSTITIPTDRKLRKEINDLEITCSELFDVDF